jgi:hypothetical protein
MFLLLFHQVLWKIMKCTKFLGKRKYLFLCYSKGNNSDMVETRIFSLSNGIIQYTYNLIQV